MGDTGISPIASPSSLANAGHLRRAHAYPGCRVTSHRSRASMQNQSRLTQGQAVEPRAWHPSFVWEMACVA